MLPPAFSDSLESLEPRDFEQIIQDGIAAVKIGDLALARRLLEQAALINGADSRIWIWLSATTENLEERRTFLERAVAVDPSNATAQRGLVLIKQKIDQQRLVAEKAALTSPEAPAPDKSTLRSYTCPNCGAAISYDINDISLVCQFCGFTRKIDEQFVSETSGKPLEEARPVARTQHWAMDHQRLSCEVCGSVVILPPGQATDRCPYCASNHLASASSLQELGAPNVIGLFNIDAQKASESIKAWMGKGILSPDALTGKQAGLVLQPAYYPFWIFDGTLEVPWFCDVGVSKGGVTSWEAQTGTHAENFTNILIPGLRKITQAELVRIKPFELAELIEYKPDHLAGLAALVYDSPLADASQHAREMAIKQVRSALPSLVEPGHKKRNFSVGEGKWSGLTTKLALLPIYTANYLFQGKRYRLLINGQTGKVSGEKPVDNFKLAMFIIGGVFILAIILAIIWIVLKIIAG